MTDEYFSAVTAFNLSWDELVTVGRYSLEFAFVPEEVKAELLDDYEKDRRDFVEEYSEDDFREHASRVPVNISGLRDNTPLPRPRARSWRDSGGTNLTRTHPVGRGSRHRHPDGRSTRGGARTGHRSQRLEPANVKQTEDGKIKVLDYGLAKVFQEETPEADSSMSPTLTRDTTRVGQ